MRIHGEKKIVRRPSVEHRSPYRKYKDILREDFAEICGYCGKSEVVTKNAFEPDHFIPIKYAPEKEEDYYNLVYSCYECNRKKASKWPSRDKTIQFVKMSSTFHSYCYSFAESKISVVVGATQEETYDYKNSEG